MLTKGEIIAAIVALGFKGSVGPGGTGEDPDLDGKDLVLWSQLPRCGYTFNDDGSVDCFFPDEDDMYNSLIVDLGFSETDAQKEIENPPHYDSVFDLLGNWEDGWFGDFDRPDLLEAIRAILNIEEEE